MTTNVAKITNRKAHFEYEILDKYEGGLKLLGTEVKSLRNGRGNLEGAYVVISGSEAFLLNAQIPAYQPANTDKGYDEHRTRKILIKKKEINALMRGTSQKGLSIIPLSIFTKGRNFKMDFAIARKKKKHDKRETIKKRDVEREMRRDAGF